MIGALITPGPLLYPHTRGWRQIVNGTFRSKLRSIRPTRK